MSQNNQGQNTGGLNVDKWEDELKELFKTHKKLYSNDDMLIADIRNLIESREKELKEKLDNLLAGHIKIQLQWEINNLFNNNK